jgi:hypothetical protein
MVTCHRTRRCTPQFDIYENHSCRGYRLTSGIAAKFAATAFLEMHWKKKVKSARSGLKYSFQRAVRKCFALDNRLTVSADFSP